MESEVDGYIVLKNIIDKSRLHACIENNDATSVDYVRMKQFIDIDILPAVEKRIPWMQSPTYTKFRYSNNNNSTDASTFHSDVYNHTGANTIPIYTCLCYFDDAFLEVIPGSHRQEGRGLSLESISKRRTIHMQPGDILVFNANIHHRGIQFDSSGDRRLLQVFEIFPDAQTYAEHGSRLTLVETSLNPVMKHVINPFLFHVAQSKQCIDMITYIHYILMYNDLHYKLGLMDIEPWAKYDRYVSYEPGRRITYGQTHTDDYNVNVMCNPAIHSRPSNYFYLFLVIFIIGLTWFLIGNLRKRK